MSRILVVEEDDVIRGLIRVILEGAGHRVVEARTGEAGLQLARGGFIDAVVLDCMDRKSDGVGTLRRMRGDAVTAHLPAIALTGLGQSGAEAGLWANAIVVKPFRPAQLLVKVEMTLAARTETTRAMESFHPRASA